MTMVEEEAVPISGLQHVIFCERQAALIHVERIWLDNALTVDGSHLHARVDDEAPRRERRGDLVILRGLPLHSRLVGLIGRADVVELHRVDHDGPDREPARSTAFANLPGRWRPRPVEYKRGRPKTHRADEVQLCAQAMCLEEMFDVEIPDGLLFYGQEHRRVSVRFEGTLRDMVHDAARRLRGLIDTGTTPEASYEERCEHCSLRPLCLPRGTSSGDAMGYVARLIGDDQEPEE